MNEPSIQSQLSELRRLNIRVLHMLAVQGALIDTMLDLAPAFPPGDGGAGDELARQIDARIKRHYADRERRFRNWLFAHDLAGDLLPDEPGNGAWLEEVPPANGKVPDNMSEFPAGQ